MAVETPEMVIMSEFLNKEFRHCHVMRVDKNALSKNKCDLSRLDGKTWEMYTKVRGKELILILIHEHEIHHLKVSFGRIGSIEVYMYDEMESDNFKKNSLLRFYTEKKIYTISDLSRYSIWRWCSEWDSRRSPDILLEHDEWKKHLFKHKDIPYFKRPLVDLMNDQRFFNGIGSFSRTEILARVSFSPFMLFSKILEDDNRREDFFETCNSTLYEIAKNGGLQFSHWKNPFNVSTEKMDNWIRCYRKNTAIFIYDNDHRKFWFLKKWKKHYDVYTGKKDPNTLKIPV